MIAGSSHSLDSTGGDVAISPEFPGVPRDTHLAVGVNPRNIRGEQRRYHRPEHRAPPDLAGPGLA